LSMSMIRRATLGIMLHWNVVSVRSSVALQQVAHATNEGVSPASPPSACSVAGSASSFNDQRV